MTLQEFAEKTDMDLKGTLERFANMEAMLVKFLKKFIDDPTFQELYQAVNNKDYDTVERAAHTLKGVAGNLGFNKLFEINQKIVNAVRYKEFDRVGEYFEEDREAYDEIIAFLTQLD